MKCIQLSILLILATIITNNILYNYLLNILYTILYTVSQQLASTSAVPGHTTHFNFYTINEPLSSRVKTTTTSTSSTTTAIAPTLRFVDVPGMGYSESTTKDDGSSDRVHSRNTDSSSNVYGGKYNGKYSHIDKKDTPHNSTSTTFPTTTSTTTTTTSSKKDHSRSWRGLLHRYFTVRDSLSLVFHLIDARQGVTTVDDEVSYCGTLWGCILYLLCISVLLIYIFVLALLKCCYCSVLVVAVDVSVVAYTA